MRKILNIAQIERFALKDLDQDSKFMLNLYVELLKEPQLLIVNYPYRIMLQFQDLLLQIQKILSLSLLLITDDLSNNQIFFNKLAVFSKQKITPIVMNQQNRTLYNQLFQLHVVLKPT